MFQRLYSHCSPFFEMFHGCPNVHVMILKYVASYVSKAHESFHNDALYCKGLNASTAAFRYAISLDVCEPEI